jgi:hypothetical protein
MEKMLRVFTFDRNTLKDNALQSAIEAEGHIKLAIDGAALTKGQSNIVGALRNYMGVLDDEKKLTRVGHTFLHLYEQNKEDAWRWLITRSLWLYVVPNGTNARANATARTSSLSFSFFRLILGLLGHLSTLPGEERFLYYQELCQILDDDAKWRLEPYELFNKLLEIRSNDQTPGAAFVAPRRLLLGDLEDEYGISRDNLNTVINKAFRQTGLFEYKRLGAGAGRAIGIALAVDLDPVLQRRIRFVIDIRVHYAGANSADWHNYLQAPPVDLPNEVAFAPESAIETDEPDLELSSLVSEAAQAFLAAGFRMERQLIQRFSASLLAERFVILTGLSGSGKTKLAQAFAQWISPRALGEPSEIFKIGQTLTSNGLSYTIVGVNAQNIEITDLSSTRKIVLPLEMVRTVANAVAVAGLDEAAASDDVIALVKSEEIFSDSFVDALAGPLVAAALSAVDHRKDSVSERHFEIISVGADWSGKENILGYPDALSPGQYVRATSAVDLILRAASDPSRPYFLILDEMNMSHVERYFSDFLSVLESGEKLQFHRSILRNRVIDGVPEEINLPQNLFVIGTVNVDETTYMFSPKVLDRANTIEFRVNEHEMIGFLDSPAAADLAGIDGGGRKFGHSFIKAALGSAAPVSALRFRAEMTLLFRLLSEFGVEFGFRTAKEVARFIEFHKRLSPDAWAFEEAMDAQICQKVLPKLHGSRRKLEPLLCALAAICWREHKWDETKANSNVTEPLAGILNATELLAEARKASELEMEYLHPLSEDFGKGKDTGVVEGAARDYLPYFPLSFDKIKRMLTRAASEGFTSFAEG